MKSTVAAAAIVIAMAATTASAGVVISQKLTVHNVALSPKTIETDQTVMVQGHKQKVITGDQEVITDLDAGKVYFVNPKAKQFAKGDFPPTGMLARKLEREGLFVGFKKVDLGPHKLRGYTCQDYIGGQPVGVFDVGVTQCVASDAPGAKEYTEFKKAMFAKLKGTPLEPKGELPGGIPVTSLTNAAQSMRGVPKGFPAAMVAQLKEENARNTVTTSFGVSKIEVKNIPADAFVVPAGYTEQGFMTPQFKTESGKPATAPNGSSVTLSAKPAKPAVPPPASAPH